MAIRRIREFLDGNDVQYTAIRHSRAFTAAEVAEAMHIPGRLVAKVVFVMIEKHLAMAVVPATREVDLTLLQKAAGVKNVRLAAVAEFESRFEGCQRGTAPPFGNLFGMETFVDRSLANYKYIAFNAGTHVDAIAMKVEDYLRLVRPKLVHIEMAPIEEQFHAIAL